MQLSGTVNVWCGARTFLLYDRIVIARVTRVLGGGTIMTWLQRACSGHPLF